MNYQQLKRIAGFCSRFTASFTQVGYRWRRLSRSEFTSDDRRQHWLVTGGSGGIGRHIVLEDARAGDLTKLRLDIAVPYTGRHGGIRSAALHRVGQ